MEHVVTSDTTWQRKKLDLLFTLNKQKKVFVNTMANKVDQRWKTLRSILDLFKSRSKKACIHRSKFEGQRTFSTYLHLFTRTAYQLDEYKWAKNITLIRKLGSQEKNRLDNRFLPCQWFFLSPLAKYWQKLKYWNWNSCRCHTWEQFSFYSTKLENTVEAVRIRSKLNLKLPTTTENFSFAYIWSMSRKIYPHYEIK